MITISNKTKLLECLNECLNFAQETVTLESDEEIGSEFDIYSQLQDTINNLEEYEE